MVKVYMASKIAHWERWMNLKVEGLQFVMRWPNMIFQGGDLDLSTPGGQDRAKECWIIDMRDICKADTVICYAEPGEILRGALVEAGMAIGMGKSVIVVGENESFGTWRYHPQVYNAMDLAQAFDIARSFDSDSRK